MLRLTGALVALVGAVGLCRAADPAPPAGNWKLTVPIDRGEETIMLVSLAQKEGKWTAEYLGASDKLGIKPVVTSVAVNGDAVKFTLGFMDQEIISFDGLLSQDKKKINGSLSVVRGRPRLTAMYPTKLASLEDPFPVAREALAQIEDGPELFDAAFQVLAKATEKKVPADEVRALVERVNKTAATFGPRWERDTTLRTVELLSNQAGLEGVAVAQAKRAEKLLTDADTAATKLATLEAVVRTLTKAGKADEAKVYAPKVAALEAADFAEYARTAPVKVEPFTGRKAKTDRAAVVELFTGAECPPCVGVDLAFDALMKAYKPSDAILLQYHVHIPGPDPLTSPDGMDRVEYYGTAVRGAPTLFVSGKLTTGSGGPAPAAEKFYALFRKAIDEAVEKPAGVKLALAVSKGEKGGYTAKATVSDLDAPGERVVLRFALAEERVRYTGGNGIRYHHMVVRSMPGGAKGFALTKKGHEQTVTVAPDDVKAALTKYLDDFAKSEEPFPRSDRPLALQNLKLVAFVQNDATKEILHAVQVDLGGK